MKFNKTQLSTLGIVILSFIVAIFVYSKMPNEMASHWDIQGQVNGYMPRFWGVFLMPFISLFMFILFLLIPKIDPMKENIQKFRKYFDQFILVLFIFLFYIFLLTIFWNLNVSFNLTQFIAPALGILFYFAAILIENAEPNWFIGIRTPWTLSNKIVWKKTHKLGAKLFKASSIVTFLGVVFPQYAFYFILIPILFSSVFSFIYSFLEFRREL